jgi:hypothetical protein
VLLPHQNVYALLHMHMVMQRLPVLAFCKHAVCINQTTASTAKVLQSAADASAHDLFQPCFDCGGADCIRRKF